jgi:hypothetical protein
MARCNQDLVADRLKGFERSPTNPYHDGITLKSNEASVGRAEAHPITASEVMKGRSRYGQEPSARR